MDLCLEESLQGLPIDSFSVVWESSEVEGIKGRLNKLGSNQIK